MANGEIQQTLQTLSWPAAFMYAVAIIALAVIIVVWIRAMLKG